MMDNSDTTTPRLAAGASLDAFAELRRGQSAPAWVLHGIRLSWHPESVSVQAVLISVSENATFLVKVDDLPTMVVRLQRPGYVGDTVNVRSELQWIEAVKSETDVRTPSPVRATDGGLVQCFFADDGVQWTAVAFEFVTGRILEQHETITPHYTEIGAVTAQLHQHSRSWVRPPGFTRFNWDLSDMVGDSPRWGRWQDAQLSERDLERVTRAQDQALRTLATLTKTSRHWGLIHSDLRPSNVMLDGDELTVIDFDDSGNSWYLYDFASSLTFYEHRSEAQEMAANWLAGYNEVELLSRDDRVAAAALSMIRRLTMLGWATTHREDALPADLWQENLPGTVEVAARYLRDPLWLVR